MNTLIVYSDCKIKEKAPFRGLLFGIKGIQIGNHQAVQKCPIKLAKKQHGQIQFVRVIFFREASKRLSSCSIHNGEFRDQKL